MCINCVIENLVIYHIIIVFLCYSISLQSLQSNRMKRSCCAVNVLARDYD